MKYPFLYYHKKRESMEQKKEYVEPEMKVVESNCRDMILCCSDDGNGGCNTDFGLAPTPKDHLA